MLKRCEKATTTSRLSSTVVTLQSRKPRQSRNQSRRSCQNQCKCKSKSPRHQNPRSTPLLLPWSILSWTTSLVSTHSRTLKPLILRASQLNNRDLMILQLNTLRHDILLFLTYRGIPPSRHHCTITPIPSSA